MSISESLRDESKRIPSEDIERLKGSLKGGCYIAGPEYETARTIWNAMIDRRPALVVRPADASDVAQAVDFARDHDVVLAVRGGGHNIAGNAVSDGGVTIDLTSMKSILVDTANRTVKAGPGVTLGELDAATQAHGLAIPVGINSTTGIAGLTLGGGFGWLSRKFGLAADNLLGAEVVTADGRVLHASERDNPDLFWALRGGGGNFGVVTSFEYRLHPVGPEVLAGLLVHPFSNAKELWDGYRRVSAAAPDELAIWVVMRKAPPLPFLPADVHGKEIVVIAVCYAGSIEEGRKAVAPVQALGKPIADVIAPVPFVGWQQALDPLLTPGARNYWKSHAFTRIDDGLIDTMVDAASRLPDDECEVAFAQLGGAINRKPADATAYPHRDVNWVLNVHTRWRDPAKDQACISWARKVYEDAGRYGTGGVYVNFMPQDEADRVQRAYGPNYERLARIKAKYDPNNLFRMNQNIKPQS
jgi:FAD/FMN-containing dehydrogenase